MADHADEFFCFCAVRLLRVGKLRAILKVAWQMQCEDSFLSIKICFHENYDLPD